MNDSWLNRIPGAVLCAYALVFCATGCAYLPGVNVDDVYRLQESLVRQGPQDRGDEDLALLQTPEKDISPLPIEQDPETGNRVIRLKLRDAVVRALAYNTDIGVASYEPAIAEQGVVRAAGAFDPVLSAAIGYNTSDNPINLTGRVPGRKTRELEVGISQRLVTGAQWELANTVSRIWNDGLADSVGRFYLNDLEFQIVQPLLRNAGTAVNLAELRVARLDHNTSLSRFREQVEETIFRVSQAYYRLLQARGTVAIAERLLKYARRTHERVKQRAPLDATVVTIKQAEAAVDQRQAALTEARKSLGDVRDTLARLIPGSQLNLVDDYELVPADELSDMVVNVDLTDRILTALAHNPSMEQVRIALKRSDISIMVAKNQVLPSLNIAAGTTIHGGDQSRNDVWEDFSKGRYASYFAQMSFEYPLGNRAAESRLAESRYRKLQNVTQLQDIADKVTQAVKEAVRRVYSAYERYQAQSRAVDSYEKELEGLEELEDKRASLTPEFLNLKLQTQEELARAQISALQAKTDYNTALVDLDRICGVLLKRYHVKLALPMMNTPGPNGRPRGAGADLLPGGDEDEDTP